MPLLNSLLLSLGVILVGCLTFRVFVRRDYQTQGKLSGFSTFMEFLIFALHANLSYIFLPVKWPGIPAFPKDPFLLYTGLIISFLGVFFTLWAMSGLGFR